MELHAAIHARRTIQRFARVPVPNEVLQNALEAAHQAPCHRLTWPWRFTLVGPQARVELAEIATAFKAEKRNFTPEQYAANRERLLDAGVLLVVRQVLHPKPDIREEDYAATCCAVQNYMLSLTAQGYGSKWSTGGTTTHPRVLALLGIPENERVVGFLYSGQPAELPEGPPRPPLDAHFSYVP